MIGLLLKDYYITSKQVLIAIVLAIALSIANLSQIYLYIFIICGSLPMTAMSYDEQCKWANFANMMPYNNKDIIMSKYLLGYISIAIIGVVIFISKSITDLILIGELNFDSYISILVLGISCSYIFLGFILPIMFKFGVEKGRVVFLVCMVILGSSITFANEINIVSYLENFPILILIVPAIVNLISILISLIIQKND